MSDVSTSTRSNVVPCAKHFVGDGRTTEGINENNTVISYKGLVHIHMAACFDAIVKGVSTVMVSCCSWNGHKGLVHIHMGPILMPLSESPPLWFPILVGMAGRCTRTVFLSLVFLRSNLASMYYCCAFLSLVLVLYFYLLKNLY